MKEQGRLFGDQVTVTIEVGNTHELVAAKDKKGQNVNRHRWAAFVRAKGQDQAPIYALIEKVKFELHETFRDPVRTYKTNPGSYP